MASLIGLLGQQNDNMQRENVQMQYLAQLKADSDKKKEDSVKMQLAEQSFYDNLNKQAEELLPYDKAKIQEKSKFLQRQVREQIKAYGGSRTEFMNNGGASLMGQYMNNLTGSEEFATFKENKKNMTMLLAALSSPETAHLVTQKDINSLKSYNNNKGGKISYSGLLPELKMPDAQAYDYGTKIPDNDIIFNENNYNALKARMIIEEFYVGDPSKITPEQVKAYFNTLGVSSNGQNVEKIKQQYEYNKAEMQEKYKFATKQLETSGKEETEDSNYNIITDLVSAKENISTSGINISDIYNVYEQGGDINKLLAEKSNTDQLNSVTSEINFDAPYIALDETGFDLNFDKVYEGRRYKIAGGRTITTNVTQGVVSQMAGGYKINELGTITYDPGKSSTAYRFDGVKLSGKRMLEANEINGEYRPIAMVAGYTGKTTDGNRNGQENGTESIITVKLDKHGNPDKEFIKNSKSGYKNGSTELKYFVALKNEETGAVFYEEIDVDNASVQEALGNELKEMNYSKTAKSQKSKQKEKDAIMQYQQQRVQYLKQQTNALDQTVFNNSSFTGNVKQYVNPGTGNYGSRAKLLKTMLIASGHDQNDLQNYLGTIIMGGGISILLAKTEGKLQSWKGSNEEFVDQWLIDHNRGQDEASIQENKIMADIWKSLL
jgi:hypothetical protein